MSSDLDSLELIESVVAHQFTVDELKSLFSAGADPDMTTRNGTPLLHLLVERGDVAAVEVTLAAKADPESQDAEKNTPLFKAYTPEMALLLLKAGTRTQMLNSEYRKAEQAIPLNAPSGQPVKDTVALLRAAEVISSDYAMRHLSNATWQKITEGQDSLPPEVLEYYLHRNHDKQGMTKLALLEVDSLQNRTHTSELLAESITANATNLRGWLQLCEQQSTPMNTADWVQSGALPLIATSDMPVLFEQEHWQHKPDLKDMFALFDALPEKAKSPVSADLGETLKHTVQQWLKTGPGQELDGDGIRQLYRDMPESLKKTLGNYHQATSRAQNTPAARSR